MAAHSSILAWRIPRTEKPGGLYSVGSQRLGHSLVTKQIAPALKSKIHLILHYSGSPLILYPVACPPKSLLMSSS